MGKDTRTQDPAAALPEPTTTTDLARDRRGTPYYDVIDPATGAHLLRVGHYQDVRVDKPEAFARFVDYRPTFLDEVARGRWKSLVVDSISQATLLGRKYHQYDLNEGARDPRQWYGGAVDLIEEEVCCQLPALPCNVGIACHVSKTKIEAEGTMVRSPLVAGRLLDMIASQWPELYYLYVERDERGRKARWLQTDSDERYKAGTCIQAPDPCAPQFEALWARWDRQGRPRHPLHVLVYGEFHAGKSTFLASFPPPIYVALFDAVGKDAAYRARGQVVRTARETTGKTRGKEVIP